MKNIVNSPNEKIQVMFGIEEGKAYYAVTKHNTEIIIKSLMGVTLKGYDELNWEIKEVVNDSRFGTWERVWGQSSDTVEDHYNKVVITLKGSFEMKITIKCFNDGLAFQYSWDQQEELTYMDILADESEFNFPCNLTLFHADDGLKEQFMNNGGLSLQTFKRGASPVTLPIGDMYVCLHEADLLHFEQAWYVKGTKENSLKIDTKSIAATPHKTPWRVILITDSLEELVLSATIENLNPPCEVEDTSWIKTGKSMWDWRNHGATYGDFTYALNTESMVKYIDFAGENNVQYLLIDGGWHPDGRDIEKVKAMEVIPELDLQYVINYGKDKGVGIILYLNDEAFVYNDIDAILATYAHWGAVGIKHGFMGTHGQRRAADTKKIAKLCAKYKLLYIPHEPERPWGMHRTYPNTISTEFVNALYDGPDMPETAPTALTIIPFTNGLTAPMDRSCGMFDMDSAHTRNACRKEALNTIASQMAECVIMFSGLLTLPDNPHAYHKKYEMFEFLKALPPMTWDETKVLNSSIGEYATIARRSGEEWFIGGVTNESPRTLTYNFDFLGDKKYIATIYSDTVGSDFRTNREGYEIKKVAIEKGGEITVKMAAGGGVAIWIREV